MSRRLRRKRNKKQTHLIIGTFLALLFVMTAGYSAFSTNIGISAKGNMKDRVDFYVSSNGSDTTGVGSKSKPYATIEKAYDKAPSSATIYIMDDITVLSTINMSSNKDIVLTSYSTNNEVNSIIRGSAFNENSNYEIMIRSEGADTLTLSNIIIDGNNIESLGNLINFRGNSHLIINDGTTLKNNISTYIGGGAIQMGENSVLVMNGGSITNNMSPSSGGIHAGPLTSVIINGGTISGNTAKSNGGGIMILGKFNMTEGMIINNIANNSGGGLDIEKYQDYGVPVATITGGTISNNTASNSGGGVFIGSTASGALIINNGNITGNTAKNKNGIYGTYTKNGGTVQSD